jgi:hypothetical protein
MRHRYILIILIAQVVITNLKTRDIMESDELGWFSIKASVGDTLLFTKQDYVPQKIAIVNTGDIPVFMEPVITLNQVTITGQTKKQELNDIMADYKKQGTFYDGKPPVLSFLTSPITGLYELFGATPGRARRFAANSKEELQFSEVHRRYNLALVMRVTNASDTVAKKFMEYYTPSFEDLKEWNDYQLIQHIHTNYDFYDKTKDKDNLRQIVLPPLVKPGTKQEPVDLSKDH